MDELKINGFDGGEAEPRPRKTWKTPTVIMSQLSGTRSVCTSPDFYEAPAPSLTSYKHS